MFASRFCAVSVVFLSASVVVAASSSAEDATTAAEALRTNPPFTGPATLPDGTFGFQLDGATAASASAAGGEEPMVVVELPRGSLLRASEALNSPLGREISARVHEQAEKAVLPVMQAGFVLAVSDLALAAAVIAHAAKHPAAWRLPSDGGEGGGEGNKKKGEGDFLASINAKPPQGLFAWSHEELVRRRIVAHN